MKVSEIMTPNPTCCTPSESVQKVAQCMRDKDCGAIPVVQGGKVVGIITDRDLALRVLADGMSADTKVGDIITRNPQCCNAEDDVQLVQRVMADNQVRRVPVVDASGRCVGIVAQADLALAAEAEKVSDHEVAIVVERISKPGRESSRTSRSSASAPEWRL
jgi:CBS domain-containing protein